MSDVGAPAGGAAEMPPHYNAHSNITLVCSFVDVDNIGGHSWRFVLPIESVRTWRSLCDKLSTCLSLIRDLEGVPYPGETTFWARDVTADGFICKEDWEQLVYGGGKYELIFRANARIKHPPGAMRTPPEQLAAAGVGVGAAPHLANGIGAGASVNGGVDASAAAAAAPGHQPHVVLPRFAGGRRIKYQE